MDFSDFSRGSTAPIGYGKINNDSLLHSELKAGKVISSMDQAFRPKTKGTTSSDINELNAALRNDRILQGGGGKERHHQNSPIIGDFDADDDQMLGDVQYSSAVENFRAVVEKWSNKEREPANARSNNVGSSSKASKAINIYTQNASTILLQPKRGGKSSGLVGTPKNGTRETSGGGSIADPRFSEAGSGSGRSTPASGTSRQPPVSTSLGEESPMTSLVVPLEEEDSAADSSGNVPHVILTSQVPVKRPVTTDKPYRADRGGDRDRDGTTKESNKDHMLSLAAAYGIVPKSLTEKEATSKERKEIRASREKEKEKEKEKEREKISLVTPSDDVDNAMGQPSPSSGITNKSNKGSNTTSRPIAAGDRRWLGDSSGIGIGGGVGGDKWGNVPTNVGHHDEDANLGSSDRDRGFFTSIGGKSRGTTSQHHHQQIQLEEYSSSSNLLVPSQPAPASGSSQQTSSASLRRKLSANANANKSKVQSNDALASNESPNEPLLQQQQQQQLLPTADVTATATTSTASAISTSGLVSKAGINIRRNNSERTIIAPPDSSHSSHSSHSEPDQGKPAIAKVNTVDTAGSKQTGSPSKKTGEKVEGLKENKNLQLGTTANNANKTSSSSNSNSNDSYSNSGSSSSHNNSSNSSKSSSLASSHIDNSTGVAKMKVSAMMKTYPPNSAISDTNYGGDGEFDSSNQNTPVKAQNMTDTTDTTDSAEAEVDSTSQEHIIMITEAKRLERPQSRKLYLGSSVDSNSPRPANQRMKSADAVRGGKHSTSSSASSSSSKNTSGNKMTENCDLNDEQQVGQKARKVASFSHGTNLLRPPSRQKTAFPVNLNEEPDRSSSSGAMKPRAKSSGVYKPSASSSSSNSNSSSSSSNNNNNSNSGGSGKADSYSHTHMSMTAPSSDPTSSLDGDIYEDRGERGSSSMSSAYFHDPIADGFTLLNSGLSESPSFIIDINYDPVSSFGSRRSSKSNNNAVAIGSKQQSASAVSNKRQTNDMSYNSNADSLYGNGDILGLSNRDSLKGDREAGGLGSSYTGEGAYYGNNIGAAIQPSVRLSYNNYSNSSSSSSNNYNNKVDNDLHNSSNSEWKKGGNPDLSHYQSHAKAPSNSNSTSNGSNNSINGSNNSSRSGKGPKVQDWGSHDARRRDRDRDRDGPVSNSPFNPTPVPPSNSTPSNMRTHDRNLVNTSPYSETWEYLDNIDNMDNMEDFLEEPFPDNGSSIRNHGSMKNIAQDGDMDDDNFDLDRDGSMKTLMLESGLDEDFLSLFAQQPGN